MIIENKSMKKMNAFDNFQCCCNSASLNKCVNKVIKKLKFIKGCLILYEPTFDIYDEEIFKKYVHNNVGFEVSQNEINLNSVIGCQKIDKTTAVYFFNLFNTKLKAQYNDLKFCSIMSFDNLSGWIFRFHIYRGVKNMWLSNDIDNYSEPLLYEIF